MTSKTIKGDTMSASNGGPARRRISLLAGSSLAAATIVLSAGGVALAPTAAWAVNDCAPVGTDPSANGATADTFTCSGLNTYNVSGVTYSSAGPLTVNATSGINVGTVGVNLTGNTTDAVTFSASGTVTGTSGPVIDVSSASGPISVSTAGVTGINANVTYGVQALSTGGGAVTVTTTGNVNITGPTAGIAAIRAASSGGNGAVVVNTSGNVTGRQYGIQAQAAGTGALTISTIAQVNTNATLADTANIYATTGTGLLTVNVLEGSSNININGNLGAAIRTSAGGDAVINIGSEQTVSSAVGSATTLNLAAVGTTTINNGGFVEGASSSSMAIVASGGALTINNSRQVSGRLNFAGVTGAAVFNNNPGSRWITAGASNFGPGTGDLNNGGQIRVGPAAIVTGLETFDNSGVIDFAEGGIGESLSMPGTAYSASGDSRMLMGAILGTAGQVNCSGALVADCFSVAGGSTSGVTSIFVVASGAVTTQANTAGITLVDVAGGVSHPGDFVLDVESTNYAEDPVYSALLTTPGWLGFALQYDAATQRHYLGTVVPSQKLEYVAALQEVVSIWHSTSDTIAGRQADLRDRGGAGAWLRVTGERITRDVDVAYTAGGAGYQYADAYEQQTTTAIGGLDVASGEMAGGEFVFGLHGGGIKSQLDRTSSPTTDKVDGVTAGLYGGWWSDTGLSLDATLNANFLNLVHDRPTEEVSDTSIISTGVRAEAGWRLAVGEGFYVQPLVTGAFVHAQFKAIVQSGFQASYEDVDSLRGGLGVRTGGDVAVGGASVGYWVTGRAWKEFSGDGAVVLATTNTAGAVTFRDDLAGEFEELGAGLSLSNASDTLEGYVSGAAKFGDDIDDVSASFGLRLRW